MSIESASNEAAQENQEPVAERLETGKKVFEFLDRANFFDIRKSDEQFEDWLQTLKYEDYSNYLTRLNGLLRDVVIQDRSVDGSGVQLTFGITGDISYLPPADEQKDHLMRETFEALKSIPDNNDRALLAYYSLQAIHPYMDGNGRTGRVLHELLSDNGKELTEDKLSLLLDHNKEGHSGTGQGRDTFAERVLRPDKAYYLVNREVAKEVLGEQFVEENGSIFVAAYVGVGQVSDAVKEKLSPEESVLVEKILGEGEVNHFPFRGIVLAKLIQEKPELQQYLYQAAFQLDASRGVVPEDYGKKPFAIHGEEIMQNLTEEDARRLIEIHKEVKEQFIKHMIEIFTEPEKNQLTMKDGRSVDTKNVFRRK